MSEASLVSPLDVLMPSRSDRGFTRVKDLSLQGAC